MNHKRLLAVALGCLSALWLAGARGAEASNDITTATRVVVATTVASPTTIIAADQGASMTCLINGTTDYLLLGGADTTFSTSATTGTFRFPGTPSGQVPRPFCLDGSGLLGAAYKGALRGVSGGSTSITVDVIRTK